MTIKRFILFSVLLHAAIIAALLFIYKHIPAPKPPQSQLMADLVTPEQIKPPTVVVPPRPHPQPRRISPPMERIPNLPPPTKEELERMPISGMPRAGSPVKSIPRAASHPTLMHTGPRTAPQSGANGQTGNEKTTSSKPGYEATGGRKHKTINLAEAGTEAAINEVEQSERAQPKSKNVIGFGTKEFRYIGYMQRLKEKIEGIWVYPRRAIEQRLEGDLEISFTINKDGTLGEVQVTRTSGYPILDDAAVRALKDGVPYWPLPDSWHMDSFTVHGTFQYVYGGMYIR